MKRIYLLGIVAFFFSSLIWHVSALTPEEQNTVDRIITRRHAHQPASVLAVRTQKILDRVNEIQQRARLTAEAWALLNYVEIRLTNILNALENKPLIPISSTPTDTILPAWQITFPTTLSVPERIDTNPLLIWWTVSPLFREIEYSVTLEPMSITDVTFQVNHDLIENRVREFALYDEHWKFISSTTPTNWRTITFDNLNLRREIGSHSFYLSVLTHSNDDAYTSSPVNFTLSLDTIWAKWFYSNDTIRASHQTNNSPSITISPVGMGTVQFVDAWNWYHPDTYLTYSETILGLLEITTPLIQSNYHQNILLDTLTIHLTDNTVTRQVANNLRLERLDIQWSTPLVGNVQWNDITFPLSSRGNDNNRIEQWQKAYFRVFADIALNNWIYESVQISVPNLKNGWITYHLEGTSEIIATIQQEEWEIFGDRIGE